MEGTVPAKDVQIEQRNTCLDLMWTRMKPNDIRYKITIYSEESATFFGTKWITAAYVNETNHFSEKSIINVWAWNGSEKYIIS